MTATPQSIWILYDGDCFLCRQFKTYLTLKQRYALQVYDGRQHPEMVAKLEAKGINTAAGMVLSIDDALYVGADAIAQVNRLVAPRYRYDRLFVWCTRHPLFVAGVYPLVKCLRALQLKLLGRSLTFSKK